MASSFRVATFNVENLFMRYRFQSGREVYKDEAGFTINKLAFEVFNETEKRITAQAIREAKADVLCLQEVESLLCLDKFNTDYLRGMGYRHRVLVDSHDPRHIDVAVLSRLPLVHLRTYRDERRPGTGVPLFSRDCLEVEVEAPGADGARMGLYVNHFKSMMGGRDKTRARRVEQVNRVVQIVDERLRRKPDHGRFAVLGDFNDYMEGNTSLGPLVGHPKLRNVVDRLDPEERWTHWWSDEDEYRQIDYVLLSERLDRDADRPKPVVIRRGLPRDATRAPDPRFPKVGKRRPSASDHCPVAVDIPYEALR